jgi:hypothetical protein
MSVSLTSPVTGAAVGSLTSPTYTLTADSPPNAHSKQWAVTALGGTQTGVDAHSISNPFTVTVERPAQFRSVGQPNPVTGTLSAQPRNVFKVRLRKGVIPLSGQSDQIMPIEVRIPVPAGADSADSNSLEAAISCLGGILNADADQIAQMIIDGIV